MRFTYPLQAFLAGKKSLVELEHDFSGVSGEELFIAVASLTALERQRLRDAIFTASLLTACSCEVYLWRPQNWEQVQETLK